MAVAFLAVAMLKVKETKADEPPSIGSSLGLLKQPVFLPGRVGHLPLRRRREPSMAAMFFSAHAEKHRAVNKESTANTFGPAMFFLC